MRLIGSIEVGFSGSTNTEMPLIRRKLIKLFFFSHSKLTSVVHFPLHCRTILILNLLLGFVNHLLMFVAVVEKYMKIVEWERRKYVTFFSGRVEIEWENVI